MQIKSVITSPKTLALLCQAVASGGNFTLGVLLARWLGMEAFGQYSLLWMGALFMLGLHQAYVTQPLMVLAAKKEAAEKAAYFQSLCGLQAVLSMGVAGLSLVAFFVLKTTGYKAEWLPWLPLTGFITAAYLIQDFLKKYCFANGFAHLPIRMDATLFGLLLPSLALLHSLETLQLGTALWAVLTAYCTSIGLVLWKMELGKPINWNINHLKKTAKEHYHYSFWLLGTSLVQWFSGNFFLVAAAGMLGAVAVGALRMAQNMVGLCHVLFLAMENIVPVEAARQFFTSGEKAMFGYLRRVGLLGGIPVVGLLAVLTLASHWLIGWLYGADYQPFAYLVAAYSVMYALGFVGTMLRFAMRSMQYTLPIFIAYATSAVASVLVARPVVAHWGMSGVVAGLVGAQALMLLVYGLFIWRKTTTPQILASSNPQILKN